MKKFLLLNMAVATATLPFWACSSDAGNPSNISNASSDNDTAVVSETASTDTTAAVDEGNGYRHHFSSRNPWVHDPVVAQEGDTLYLFCTGRGITQMHTTNMVDWQLDGPCLDTLPHWVYDRLPEATMHVWAPDIIRVGNLWHLFYCCSAFGKNTSVIGHLTSRSLNRNSPLYGWKDAGLMLQSIPHRDNWNAIDPNVVVCSDGSSWMSFGSFWGGIKMVRLSDDLSSVAEPQQWYTIASRQRTDMEPDDHAGNAAIEAPFVFQHEGWFYLFASHDYCCRGAESTYHVVVGRSRSVSGPYVDASGQRMDFGGGTTLPLPPADAKRYVAAGHCAVANLSGRDYIIMHAYTHEDGHPELLVRRLQWNADGFCSILPATSTSEE